MIVPPRMAVAVENSVTSFFEDKFYETTTFAQDKLESYLLEKLRTVEQFVGLKGVKLTKFSFD